ncbi:hypothetical protein Scep_006657 [Stephania cephalantha]|uniref:Secreted protein n=1 Tax=Stephania cephalantha TaxID=152367 RepID=A0AAP0KB44_9MAGN
MRCPHGRCLLVAACYLAMASNHSIATASSRRLGLLISHVVVVVERSRQFQPKEFIFEERLIVRRILRKKEQWFEELTGELTTMGKYHMLMAWKFFKVSWIEFIPSFLRCVNVASTATPRCGKRIPTRSVTDLPFDFPPVCKKDPRGGGSRRDTPMPKT